MKKLVLDRRKLLGTALFGSSSMAMAAVPASIFSQLEGEGAEATVAGIVQQYFPLP